MNKNILVIGGTGTIGQSLVQLLEHGKASFTVLTRTPEKAAPLQEAGISTVMGSLGNWPNIENILPAVDTVFLLTSPSPEQVELQNGLVDRAKSSGVRKIVKLSAVVAANGPDVHLRRWHAATEKHLRESGLEYVILQPHSFMQNILMSLETIQKQNAIYESIGSGKIPMVDTRDVAKTCYRCLTSDEYNGKDFIITGPNSVGYEDLAKAISNATDRKINYIPIPKEAHNQAMKSAGLPDWLADDLTDMSEYWSDSQEEPTPHFENITGAQPVDIDQFAQDYADLFRS